MNTETKTAQNGNQSVIDTFQNSSRREKHKLVEELWEYCRKYPNDTDLGKNLRMFILTQSMK